MKQTITHTIPPCYDSHSRILILGTMPSPKSREYGFYYGHPQNRFWKIISDLLEKPLPTTNQEKQNLLLQNQIALWDVLKSCEIDGASDSSIQNPIPNNLSEILSNSQVHTIFTTGAKAYQLYEKYCFPQTKIPAISLPSTSPANCRTSYQQLKAAYQILLDALKQ